MLRVVHPAPSSASSGNFWFCGAGRAWLGPVRLAGGNRLGLVTTAALTHGFIRSGRRTLGAANRVTLTRAALVGGVTALVADALVGSPNIPVIVGLAVVALILDGVDGWVARRTRTVSALGARFDMEVDAFLILVLSVYVAGSVGPWVLAIGAARYAFWGPAAWCGGYADHCRRDTGANPSPRSRASYLRPPWPPRPRASPFTWRSSWRWRCSPSPLGVM